MKENAMFQPGIVSREGHIRDALRQANRTPRSRDAQALDGYDGALTHPSHDETQNDSLSRLALPVFPTLLPRDFLYFIRFDDQVIVRIVSLLHFASTFEVSDGADKGGGNEQGGRPCLSTYAAHSIALYRTIPPISRFSGTSASCVRSMIVRRDAGSVSLTCASESPFCVPCLGRRDRRATCSFSSCMYPDN